MVFQSNADYFAAIRSLASEIEGTGNQSVANNLAASLEHINGLTDGWAAHLECLLDIESDSDAQITDGQMEIISQLCDAAYEAVYRRKRD